MIIGITGENGFLGSNLVITAKRKFNYRVLSLGRNFSCGLKKISKIDWIIHCASTHRSENPIDVYSQNIKIHKDLIGSVKARNLKPNIIFLSSIQEGDRSPYGESKKDGASMLSNFIKYYNLF